MGVKSITCGIVLRSYLFMVSHLHLLLGKTRGIARFPCDSTIFLLHFPYFHLLHSRVECLVPLRMQYTCELCTVSVCQCVCLSSSKMSCRLVVAGLYRALTSHRPAFICQVPALHSWLPSIFLPSPTSSVCFSPQVSSILFSENLLTRYFSRNLLQTKTNSQITGQSSTSLRYRLPK